MIDDGEIRPAERENQQERRRLAAELTAEFDIPFVIWEDFEQALSAGSAKARKV